MNQKLLKALFPDYRYVIHRFVFLLVVSMTIAACTFSLPDPPVVNLPTQPAVLDITPAPTLDIDATATVLASQFRPSPTPIGLYVVQSGDTLTGLAERFTTTVDELIAANNLPDANSLQAGQELIIPSLLPTPRLEGSARTPVPTVSPIGELTPTQAITLTEVP